MHVCPQAGTHTHRKTHTVWNWIMFIQRKNISKYDLDLGCFQSFQCSIYLLTFTLRNLWGRFVCDFDRLYIIAHRPCYGTVLPACHTRKLVSLGCQVGITLRHGHALYPLTFSCAPQNNTHTHTGSHNGPLMGHPGGQTPGAWRTAFFTLVKWKFNCCF